jgi:probable HAF family extracellular repeat protein
MRLCHSFLRNLSAGILLGSLTLNALSAHAQYKVVDLGTLGGNTSSAASINQAGHIAGASTDATGNDRAFLWADGQLTDLGTVSGYGQSRGNALNSHDAVAGQILGAPYPTSVFHASLYQNGTMTDLGSLIPPPSSFSQSQGWGINDRGQVVGYSEALVNGNLRGHAVLWDPILGMQDLTPTYNGVPDARAWAINNAGQVVGALGSHAFLYSNGVVQDLTNSTGISFSARDINEVGVIVGGQSTSISGNNIAYGQAVLWQSGQAKLLGTLQGFGGSSLGGINDFGQSVGSVFNFNSSGITTAQDAILYANSQILDLNSLIPATSGWHLNYASGINNSGAIVGQGVVNGQLHGFLLVATPEPGTAALLISLLLGGGTVLRQRRRRRNRPATGKQRFLRYRVHE